MSEAPSGTPIQGIPKPPATPNRVVMTSFAETVNANPEKRSPWVTLESPRPKQAIVRRVDLRTAPRSVSTFSAQNRSNAPAAPFPSIPTRMEIQEQKSIVEQEILSAKAELSALQHQRKFYENSSQIGLIPPGAGQGIKSYNNLLISESLIESVRAQNQELKRQSEVKVPPKFRNITELPQYQRMIDEHSENVAFIFSAHMGAKHMILEKQQELARIYNDSYRVWMDEIVPGIDAYNARVYKLSDEWPAEFPKTKNERGADLKKWTAPDQPMLMTRLRKVNDCYYNTNEDVPDPEAEHEEFKTRTSWSDEEKRKFVAKYTQHPKRFRLIAEALPLKTVKDVIEFYYINKFTLSLKEKEGARGRRMKRVQVSGNDVK